MGDIKEHVMVKKTTPRRRGETKGDARNHVRPLHGTARRRNKNVEKASALKREGF